jgi:hypothetical protein
MCKIKYIKTYNILHNTIFLGKVKASYSRDFVERAMCICSSSYCSTEGIEKFSKKSFLTFRRSVEARN